MEVIKIASKTNRFINGFVNKTANKDLNSTIKRVAKKLGRGFPYTISAKHGKTYKAICATTSCREILSSYVIRLLFGVYGYWHFTNDELKAIHNGGNGTVNKLGYYGHLSEEGYAAYAAARPRFEDSEKLYICTKQLTEDLPLLDRALVKTAPILEKMNVFEKVEAVAFYSDAEVSDIVIILPKIVSHPVILNVYSQFLRFYFELITSPIAHLLEVFDKTGNYSDLADIACKISKDSTLRSSAFRSGSWNQLSAMVETVNLKVYTEKTSNVIRTIKDVTPLDILMGMDFTKIPLYSPRHSKDHSLFKVDIEQRDDQRTGENFEGIITHVGNDIEIENKINPVALYAYFGMNWFKEEVLSDTINTVPCQSLDDEHTASTIISYYCSTL
jgi:hypothetical protein